MILEEMRREVVEIGRKILKTGLVTVTWGNVSVKDPESGYIAITPSAMDYDIIKPEDIVIVSADGTVIDGERNPSSETLMHLYIYEKRPEVNAIVHTHSTYATAIGVTRGEIPMIIGEVANAIGGSIETAEFAPEGTVELGKSAVEKMNGKAATLLQNHGVVVVGRTLKDAFFNAVVVEDAAKVYSVASKLGNVTTIPASEADRLHADFLATYDIK